MTRSITARRGALIGLAVAGALAGSIGGAAAQYYVYEDEVFSYPSPRRGYIYGHDYDFYAPRPPAAVPQRSIGRIAARQHGLAQIERSIRRGDSWVVDGRRRDGSRARLILDAHSGELIDSITLDRARPQAEPAPRVARTAPAEAPPAQRIVPRATPAPVMPRTTPVPVPPGRPAGLKPPAQASAPARTTPPSAASPQRAAPPVAKPAPSSPEPAAPETGARPDGATAPDGRPVRVIPMSPAQTQPASPPPPAEAKAPATDAPRAPTNDAPRLVDPNDVRPATGEPERAPPLARAPNLPPPPVMPPVELKPSDVAPEATTD